jgi:hypothetical protein
MEVARKKRQGWRIPQLAKDLERVFRVGDTVVRVLVKSARGEVLLFFTPVSARLQRMAGRLNQLLHAQSARSDDDRWWEKTRQFLENVAEELQLASTGVLLGPPQIHVRTKEVNLNAVFTDAAEAALVTQVLGAPKTHLTIEVRYLKALPDLVKHGVAVKLASGSGAGDNAAPNPAS